MTTILVESGFEEAVLQETFTRLKAAQSVRTRIALQADESDQALDDGKLLSFIQSAMGIHIPTVAVCPDHDAPFSFVADFFFERETDAIILANRAGGKTQDVAGLHLANANFKPGFETSHIGAIEIQAKRCYSYYRQGLRSDELRHHAPDPHIRETIWINGSKIEILPGTEAQTQGGHPGLAAFDELEQGKRQPYENAKSMPVEWVDQRGKRHPGQFLATSTRQNALGLMQRALDEAAANGIRVYTWCLDADSAVSTPTGTRALRDVRPGDDVFGWDGSRIVNGTVVWSKSTGTKRTIEIQLSNGKTLRCTPDHRVLTSAGWRYAGTIRAGECLIGEMPVMSEGVEEAQAEHGGEAKNAVLPMVLAGRFDEEEHAQSVSMRSGDSEALQAMRRLLSQGSRRAESYSGEHSGSAEGGKVLALSDVEGRTAGSRIVRCDGRVVACACSVRDVNHRPDYRQPRFSGRGIRRLLAQHYSGEGARCQARNGGSGVGVPSCDPSCFQDASLVAHAAGSVEVLAVKEGPAVEVWDICVPGLDSFVAEGVVVHNCVIETIDGSTCVDGDGAPLCEGCPIFAAGCEGRALSAGGWRSRDEIIRTFNRVGSDTWEAQHLCRKPDAKALIYSNFGKSNITEVAEYIEGAGPLFMSYDWGFTDPTQIDLLQYRDGAFYQFDELVGNQRSEREWVRLVVERIVSLPCYKGPPLDEWDQVWLGKKEWPHPWPDPWIEIAAGDPSAVQMRHELKEHGIGARGAQSVRHEVEAGQDVMRAAISTAGGLRRYFVHPRCKETIRAFESYRARELADGSFDPRPDPDPANHVFSHGTDSPRYLMWACRRYLGLGGESDGE